MDIPTENDIAYFDELVALTSEDLSRIIEIIRIRLQTKKPTD